MTEPKMIINFFKIESNSVAYATLCKIIYDTIKSHHKGFWIQTEESDPTLEILKELDLPFIYQVLQSTNSQQQNPQFHKACDSLLKLMKVKEANNG